MDLLVMTVLETALALVQAYDVDTHCLLSCQQRHLVECPLDTFVLSF